MSNILERNDFGSRNRKMCSSVDCCYWLHCRFLRRAKTTIVISLVLINRLYNGVSVAAADPSFHYASLTGIIYMSLMNHMNIRSAQRKFDFYSSWGTWQRNKESSVKKWRAFPRQWFWFFSLTYSAPFHNKKKVPPAKIVEKGRVMNQIDCKNQRGNVEDSPADVISVLDIFIWPICNTQIWLAISTNCASHSRTYSLLEQFKRWHISFYFSINFALETILTFA